MFATIPNVLTRFPYRRWGAAAVLLCAGAHSSWSAAAQASAVSVEKLLSLNGAQKSIAQAVANYEVQVRQQVVAGLVRSNEGRPLTAQQQQAVEKAVPGVVAVLHEEMSWDKLKEDMVKAYQGQLTQAEVDRLIQLYQDPAYVRVVEKMQTVNIQTSKLLMGRMPAIVNKMQPILEDAVKP